MVRRPAITNWRGDTLEDALELAAAFCGSCFTTCGSSASRSTPKSTMLTLDLSSDAMDSVAKQLQRLQDSDGRQIHIFPIAPYNESAIYLQGHVLRPGRYSYREGMKLTDLLGRTRICCRNRRRTTQRLCGLNAPDYRPQLKALTCSGAGKSAAARSCSTRTVRIFSRYDFEPRPSCGSARGASTAVSYVRPSTPARRDSFWREECARRSLDSAQLFRTQAMER